MSYFSHNNERRFRRTISTSFWLAVFGSFLVSAPVQAQTGYPMLMALDAVAAQQGETTELTVHSRYTMFGAYQVLVSGEGVTGVIDTPMELTKEGKKPAITKLKVRFTVAEDAMPGVRDFRLATPQGVSTIGQLVVTKLPVVSEKGANNTQDQSQQISVPAAVCGTIEKGEDVDVFKFKIDQPGDWTFHMRSMRLQDKIHDLQQHSDPILTLRSAAGAVLAVSDNYFHADPFLTHYFDKAGEYFMEIRDVRYAGNRYWKYCVEVDSSPYVSVVHPLVVTKGQTAKIELRGPSVPENTTVEFTPSGEAPMGMNEVLLPMEDSTTNPVNLLVSDAEPLLESNDPHHNLETAQPATVPGLIAGTLANTGELDLYQFEAKKGDKLSFEVKARRLQSSLDSVIRILNAEGKALNEQDDLRLNQRTFADSKIENWTAPADGVYYLEIRDLHLRGGDTFAYAIESTKAEPHFELYLDTDKTQLTPGTSGVMFIRAVRKNGFAGEIDLKIEGVPEGVSAHCGTIPAAGLADGCIILTAAKEAKQLVGNIVVSGIGKHKVAEEEYIESEAIALPHQETYRPGGGRGHWEMLMHTVSVGAPSDIRNLTLSTYDVTLKPGEKVKIDVEIERAEGFEKNVSLAPIFKHLSGVWGNTLPPNVKVVKGESKILLTGKETKGHLILQADAKAKPSTRRQVPVMANIALNFVMKSTYSSTPLWVTVAKPE